MNSQESLFSFDKGLFNEEIKKLCQKSIEDLDLILQRGLVFNLAFFALEVLEFFLLVIFSSLIFKSSLFAFCLALFFLSVFSHFVLRLYLQAQKPEQFVAIRNEYVDACKHLIRYQEVIAEHHMALASSVCRLAELLHDREYSYYYLPNFLELFTATAEKFSAWWHWQDIHRMKELLLEASIDEHVKLVKCEPTNLEVHATLANAYVMLSSLYVDPRKEEGFDEERWLAPERYSMHKKFRQTAQRAIEEFKILNDYAPDDPWVHVQLAYSYHDLQMPQEEIREYETILKLRPEDYDTLFKLGMLYFQQGMNSKGLRVYEQLKDCHYKKAENLIKFYGSYQADPDEFPQL